MDGQQSNTPQQQQQKPQIPPNYAQFMEQNQHMLTNMMAAFIQAQNQAPAVK